MRCRHLLAFGLNIRALVAHNLEGGGSVHVAVIDGNPVDVRRRRIEHHVSLDLGAAGVAHERVFLARTMSLKSPRPSSGVATRTARPSRRNRNHATRAASWPAGS